jgi:hypothetical protein
MHAQPLGGAGHEATMRNTITNKRKSIRHKIATAVLATLAFLSAQEEVLSCELLGFYFNKENGANQGCRPLGINSGDG